MRPVLTVDLGRVAFHRFVPAQPLESGSAVHDDPFGGGQTAWPYLRWTSDEREIGFAAGELVPSWTAHTPAGSWLEIELQARMSTGELSKWYVMGRWAEGESDIHRTSVPGQGDDDGDVAVDTLVARRAVTAFRVRVTLHGSGASVGCLGVMASAVTQRPAVQVSPPGTAGGIVLDVPRHSQHVHHGHYPQWDGGGANWCSPASVAMIQEFWGRSPGLDDLAWVRAGDPCPAVDHAARGMYDHSYQGTGNWPFSVAYAGAHGLHGFVTRLRSLVELERFIEAGIPVITSLSFKEHELPGSGYSTRGHIMVVAGFTESGDVVANDPAAPSDEQVRRVYPRAAFEQVWLRASGSGGIVYVIHPPQVPLPPSDGNW